MTDTNRICSLGIWDDTIPGIQYNATGISNYAEMFQKLVEQYPKGEKGKKDWENWLSKIKKDGKNKKYDCIIGVSGGTDSSYLMYLTKTFGLRPLAVNLDNGWSSDIAVKNIKKITNALNIDLETYVIEYEEVKRVLRSYIKASFPWIDAPTDLAIKAVLYKIALREKIKYIFNGSDFRSEGKQPTEWTYSDAKQFSYLINKFENGKLKSYPYCSLSKLFYYGYFKKIKMIRPFYYLDYNKSQAQEFIKKEYGWEYYGGHHHENLFTKFAIAFWLPKKFGIDKRIITLSALVLSKELSREKALTEIKLPPYDPKEMEKDKKLVLKKLDFSEVEFEEYFNRPNKYYYDYPSYFQFYSRFYKITHFFFKYVLPFTPSIFTEQQIRHKR